MTTNTTAPASTHQRYLRPTAIDRLTAWLLRRLVRIGITVWGARELRVRGRKSGQTRTTIVNVLELDGASFLVAPRGVTEWVRNVRAAAACELRTGRRVDTFAVRELADADKVAVIRAYLERWAFEVGRFFEGVTKDSSDADLLAVAPGFPVFELTVS